MLSFWLPRRITPVTTSRFLHYATHKCSLETLVLTLPGLTYPPVPPDPPLTQRVAIGFHCSGHSRDPTFSTHDTTEGVSYLDWRSKAGCAQKGAVEPPPQAMETTRAEVVGEGGAGVVSDGSSLCILLIIVIAYFGLGVFDYYSTIPSTVPLFGTFRTATLAGCSLPPEQNYGALCSTIRPGGSRRDCL